MPPLWPVETTVGRVRPQCGTPALSRHAGCVLHHSSVHHPASEHGSQASGACRAVPSAGVQADARPAPTHVLPRRPPAAVYKKTCLHTDAEPPPVYLFILASAGVVHPGRQRRRRRRSGGASSRCVQCWRSDRFNVVVAIGVTKNASKHGR